MSRVGTTGLCPDCNGAGKTKEGSAVCTKCNGTGNVHVWLVKCDGILGRDSICPKCGQVDVGRDPGWRCTNSWREYQSY